MTLTMWMAILIAGVGGSAAALFFAWPDLTHAPSQDIPES